MHELPPLSLFRGVGEFGAKGFEDDLERHDSTSWEVGPPRFSTVREASLHEFGRENFGEQLDGEVG